MEQTPGFVRISCCVEPAEGSQAVRARYGLRMLLLPYRAEAEFVPREFLRAPGIYYGPRTADLPDGVLAIHPSDATWPFLEAAESPWPEGVYYAKDRGDRVPVPFPATGGLDIDPVASAFYFLSGWQEIVVRKRDEHGRFPFEESFQRRFGTAHLPVVDVLRMRTARALEPCLGEPLERKTFSGRAWAFCPTHDIDYLKKWRRGIVYRDIVHRGLGNRAGESLGDRMRRIGRALAGPLSKGDPYRDAAFRIIQATEKRGGRGTFFFKAGETAPHDTRYSLAEPAARRLIQALAEAGFEAGLHPSYHAYRHGDHLEDELKRLRAALPPALRSMQSIRAHYLRYHHPDTLHTWIDSSLGDQAEPLIDSTLGFAEHIGFRHGTCLPFPLFDPVLNEETNCWEMPLACMESALFNRMHLGPEEAARQTEELIRMVQRCGGVFVGLWHNTLWDEDDCPGWGAHFEATLDLAQKEGALIAPLKDTLNGWI